MGRSVPRGSPSSSHVELRLAGTFRVIRDGTELAGGQIGSRKSRMLLKLLAVERPALVPVDRIVEVLWPGERPAAPEQNVATLVSRLRAALGAELIQGGRPGYRLAAGQGIVVDLDAAAGFCDQAESKLATAAAVALAGAERALELLAAGTAIDDEPYADWADRAREQVRELLRRARLTAAQAVLTTGGARLAMGYAEAAMAADPLDETAHRWYMSASAAAGEQAKALAAYEALRQRLGDELGVDPAPQTRELHLAILREQEGKHGRGPGTDEVSRRSLPGGTGPAQIPSASTPRPRGTALAGRDGEIGVLVVSGRDYEFANDLIREALYASTPEPSRLAHHRRAADLLTGQPESLARHAAAAGDWLRAARAWLRAGEDAMSQYAASDAAALATQALEAAERVADTEVSARALVLRGRAHHAVGDDAAALADLTRGADDARAIGDRRLQMRALYELGADIPVQRGLPISHFASSLEDGLRIAESLGDRASEANMMSQLAVIAANRLRLDAALDYGLRGVAAGRAAADDHALASGLDGLKIAYLSLGDTRGLTVVLDELVPLLRSLGDPFLLQWAQFEGAFPAIAAADWEMATAAIEKAVELNHRSGYPHTAAWYVAHLGWLARLQGREDAAMTLGRQAVELTEQYQVTWWQATACAMLGGTMLLAGDRAGAIGLFERALTRLGEKERARTELDRAARLAAEHGLPYVLRDASEALRQL